MRYIGCVHYSAVFTERGRGSMVDVVLGLVVIGRNRVVSDLVSTVVLLDSGSVVSVGRLRELLVVGVEVSGLKN